MDMNLGKELFAGRYRIVRKRGEGGSSIVMMGVDEATGDAVTIKQMKKGAYNLEDMENFFGEEADILKELHHPAIPRLVEAYDDAFVLEYVSGNNLEKYIRHKGLFKEKEAVAVGLEILDILSYLHERENPIVYRDLKPANIMMRHDGHITLIDFGAARHYEAGSVCDTVNLGTNGFAAPEQYGNLGQTDPRTDIYCFGRTLLQIMGGKCSPELMMIIDKCTRPDRDDRFENCSKIIDALTKYPGVVRRKRVLQKTKLVVAAAVIALIVSFAITHYESVVSYAANDAQTRVPAVKERLGYAGIRVRDWMEETGIVVDGMFLANQSVEESE